MMRRTALLLAALCLAAAAAAQAPANDAVAEIGKLLTEAEETWYTHGEIKKAEKLFDRIEKRYMALPDSLKARTEIDYWFHFRHTVLRLWAGRRKAAVTSFERYVDGVIGQAEEDIDRLDNPTLDPLRSDKRFQAAAARLRAWCDYPAILRDAAPYRAGGTEGLPPFRYAEPNDRNLVELRTRYNLDSIAGAGDELSKIFNLMRWVHDTVPHDGSARNPEICTAENIIETSRREGHGYNCRMLAQALNECYLAMGFRSRFITCLPRVYIDDCHVVNAVYSATLDKWIYVDPSFEAYVTDEQGTPLSPAEIREGLRSGRTLLLNKEANQNHRTNDDGSSTVDKKWYLDNYMSKNLYLISCPDRSMYSTESHYEGHPQVTYFTLAPEGFASDDTPLFGTVTDDAWFWQSPYTAQ